MQDTAALEVDYDDGPIILSVIQPEQVSPVLAVKSELECEDTRPVHTHMHATVCLKPI